MADQQVQGMLVQIEATTAQLRRELANADQVVARTTDSIDRNLAQVDSAFDSAGGAAQQAGVLIRGAFAAVAGAGIIGSIIKQVDAYGQMSDRMKAAAGSAGEYQMVQEHLLRTAQETYRPLAEAQELYIRTADVMRSLGFNTQQTLDITDSFSFLLVTNAAAADKAGSALDAYSKALQTGKVEADGWVSIQEAMPTIVTAIANATGKSAEEIRKLGVQGKLSLDDINTGLLRTVEANRRAAADMSTSVQDALVNIGNAVQTFLGGMEEQTGAVAGLSNVLIALADNVDLVAVAMGGAGVAALTNYVAKSGLAVKAALADRAARIAQAEAVLQAALADQRKAETATILAAREAVAARGTAVQTQMSIQLAQARQREAAATTAVATAQAGLRTVSAGLLSVLGGPMGLALLAGTAAASFLLLSNNADQAGVSLEDLRKPVAQLREEFAKLNKDQREASLVKWQQEQITSAEKVKDAYGDLAQSIRSAVVTAPARDSGGQYNRQLAEYKGLVDRLNEARTAGQGLSPILQEVGNHLQLPSSTVQQWITQAGAVSDADQRSSLIAETLRVLTGVTQENTSATQANNAAKVGMSSAGQTYLETLQKQLAGLQDNGDATKIANRYIAENADLTETDRQAILSAASAIESQKKANKDATEGSKDRTKALKDEIKALDAIIDRALPEKKRLEDLAEGVQGLRKAQAAGRITAAEMELGIKNLNTAYADPVLQKRAEEEKKLAEIRRNSAEAYRKAMEVVLQTRQDAIDADVSGVGMGDDQREEADRLNAVRQKYAESRRQLEEQQEDVSRRLSQDAYQQRLTDLADYQARELQMEVDGFEARLEAQRDYRNGAKRAWANIQSEAANVAGATDDMLTTGFNSARDAVAEFAMTGKANFKSFAVSVISDMAKIASQQAASSLLSGLVGLGVSAVGSYFGGGGGNGMAPGSAGAVSSNLGASQAGYGSAYFPQALGGAWSGGVQLFAKGAGFATNSVLNTPTMFGMGNGGLGVAGEDGPEAIMPLARGPDGSLGVQMVGGAGGGSTVLQLSIPVAVTLEDRSGDGMELDSAALQQNMERQMRGVAERAISDSWRAGGLSHRNSNGRH
ncbi:phage tail tape measure protein [Pseudomonas sp. GD03651]|uniref:phage tail tape measure protein n=1 Tax=Pseudomonas TaxID=286 RepID=UPI00034EDAD8|nr:MULTISPECIES: phage tail tape measure protein [Pseudomonas]AGN81541.1 tail tape measure protein [Pseudomonas putida H8234]MDH2188168.1 phage tail tape measure protein [Pseudomonas sp. GD03651]HDS1815270.1 phage tail tape measure protein [Pseudomonas putida]HDS3812451.1 phage tail tape measure protein [Pseudomonas putida]